MSHLVGYGAFGVSDPCAKYIVSGDGRCADTAGVHAAGAEGWWYNLLTGRCERPPGINCDVNAPNLPASCPPGEVRHSASGTGCSPGKPGGPAPKGNGNGIVNGNGNGAVAGISPMAWVFIAVAAGGLAYIVGRQTSR